jgi:hypothetical protein
VNIESLQEIKDRLEERKRLLEVELKQDNREGMMLSAHECRHILYELEYCLTGKHRWK